MAPFTALVAIPTVFALFAIEFSQLGLIDPIKGNIGDFVLDGIATTSTTGIMLLFAILYFSTLVLHKTGNYCYLFIVN